MTSATLRQASIVHSLRSHIVGGITLKALLYSLSIATTLAIAQTWLKVMSRKPREGKKFPLEREDALWWIEWVAAGTVALAVSLIVSSHDHKISGAGQPSLAIGATFLGYSALPFAHKTWFVDEQGKVKGVKELLILNGCGILVLTAAVALGARVYG